MADENGVVLPGDEGVLQERSRARMYTSGGDAVVEDMAHQARHREETSL